MDAQKRRAVSLVSSGILAVLTLSVFMASINKGPASAVTRFNQAITARDPVLLREVSSGQMNSPSMDRLVQQISMLMQSGANFQINRVIQSGDGAVVYTRYAAPNNVVISIVFSAHKYGKTWLVSPEETVALTARQTSG